MFFLFISCKGKKSDPVSEDIPPLYSKALIIALDTINGYLTNPISGDSIKNIFGSSGDTIKTGIGIPFTGHIISADKTSRPEMITIGAPVEINIATNVHPVTEDLSIILVDTNKLKKVKLGEGNQSFVLQSSSGIIPTGIPIPVTTEKITFLESPPIKALPLRFKDAATANVQYLDVDQGLSSSYIYSLLEDKKGNMWFGIVGGGISKYDGVNFINYTAKESLGDNSLNSLIEDHKGNIWFNSSKGVISFDGKTFTNFTGKEGLTGKRVSSLLEDRKGNIWITTLGNGVCKYDRKKFTWFTSKEGLCCDSIITCMEDKKGNIWLGSYHGVMKFDGVVFTWYTQQDGLKNDCIASLLEDSSGNLWMGSGSGIFKYDGKAFTNYTEKNGLSSNLTWSLQDDKRGNIWIGTSFGGINKFDGRFFTHYNLAEGLSNNKVRQIIEDSNGNIWFGTDGGGVNKINDGNFSYLTPNEVFNNNRIRPIMKDKAGNIWFGTESAGFGKYEESGLSKTTAKLTYFTKKNRVNGFGQRSLLQDNEGNIWIGTIEDGIYKLDVKNIVSYPLKESLPGTTIFSMMEDKKGNTWFGTGNRNYNVVKYNGTDFTGYTEKDGLPGSTVFCLHEDKKGNTWLGTNAAVLSKITGNTITHYSALQGFFGKSITSIIEDEKGNLWLGTSGAGVCKFDGEYFTYYTQKQGLSNNNVWSLIKDSADHIWAGTDNGLNRFVIQQTNQRDSADNYIVYSYGLSDGLKAIDFNLNGVCIDNSNRIWWGTGKNILTKSLRQPFTAANPRSLSLTTIEINDRFYDYRNIPDRVPKRIQFSNVAAFTNYPVNLKLSYDQNHLSFHFSAIDWSAPDKIKYSFRLSGVDKKWSIPSEETKAEYRGLRYGNYIFEVRAVGQSQVWTESFTYKFTIEPAWWQTRWFKLLMGAALLTLIFFIARFIYFYQLRKQRVGMEKQLAIQYERQRISAEMHDDIGAGLSGIRLLTEMTKNKIKGEQAAEDVEKIYQSVDDISAKMKEVIWSLNTEHDNLPNLLFYIQKQIRIWLEHYPCQLSIDIPGNIPSLMVNGDARRNIFLVVKEAIHNIIKHSGANKVAVSMDYSNKELTITIADNGKGMDDNNMSNSGNGIKNIRERIEKLNGKCFIKKQEGVTLIASIPL